MHPELDQNPSGRAAPTLLVKPDRIWTDPPTVCRARRLDILLGVDDLPVVIRRDACHSISHRLSIRFGPETPGILAHPRYVYLLRTQSDFDEPVNLETGALVCPRNKIQNERPSRRF